MRTRVLSGCAVAILLLALSPLSGMAQNIGFQVGIAPPSVRLTTPQAPAIAVRSPVVLVPRRGVPVAPGPVFAPSPVVIPGPIVVIPAIPVQQPLPVAVPIARRLPPIGTSRADVLRLLGQPSTVVITSAGETLFFAGNVTVIMQNDLVVGPR